MKIKELSLLIFMYSIFKKDKLVSESKLVFSISYWNNAFDSENFILELTGEINESLRPLYSTYTIGHKTAQLRSYTSHFVFWRSQIQFSTPRLIILTNILKLYLGASRNINPLALELDAQIVVHHLSKMWLFYEPKKATLWNTRYSVEE